MSNYSCLFRLHIHRVKSSTFQNSGFCGCTATSPSAVNIIASIIIPFRYLKKSFVSMRRNDGTIYLLGEFPLAPLKPPPG